ncbi:hypothetical protein [Helicobacter didelphidarum]|nr:hypothetical protein [Helicobacter didelphidarum]
MQREQEWRLKVIFLLNTLKGISKDYPLGVKDCVEVMYRLKVLRDK